METTVQGPKTHRGIVHDHTIALVFILCIALILVVGFFCFLLGRNLTIHLFVLAMVATIATAGLKLWKDNRSLPFSRSGLCILLLQTTLWWFPFGVATLPGLMLTIWCDGKVEQGVQYLHGYTDDKVRIVQEEVEREISESGTYWWNPWTWGSTVKRKVHETVSRPVLERTRMSVKVVFGLCYSLLRLIQYLYYSAYFLVLVRSFGFFLVRTAVRRQSGLEFCIPNKG